MKLATLREGGRDGTLLVVSRDLSRAVPVGDIAATLQAALDAWREVEPALRERAERLERGALTDAFDFELRDCMAPLPRAYQWLDASAYVNHVALVRRARGAQVPETFWTDPLMYQGGSDTMLGGRDPIALADQAHGLDFEAELAVVTDDVPRGVAAERAARHVKLVMLVNDVSLRGLIPDELAKGFGFVHGKPPSAFAPCAVTPDELGERWMNAIAAVEVTSWLNGTLFGRPDAGRDMTFDFARLIAHAAHTRPLGAGTIIGSGTVSNRDADEGPGKPAADGGCGYSCIAEQRTVETILHGEPRTPFMKPGDRVRIEVELDGRSLFGAIEQEVVAA